MMVVMMVMVVMMMLRTSAAKMDIDEGDQHTVYSELSQPDQLHITDSSSRTELSAAGSIKVSKRVNLPKRQVVEKKKPKPLREILPSRKPISKPYFTTGRKINDETERPLEEKTSPFSYPNDMEQFAHSILTKAWRHDVHVNEMKLKCSQKSSYIGKQKENLIDRLYTKEATTDTAKSILQVDPQYFSIIGGSVPREVKIGDYIDTVRECLRTKIVTGYREDDILLIDESLGLEQNMINEIKRNYQMYVDIFEEFLAEDHALSMEQLCKAEEAKSKVHAMYKEYLAASKKYGALRASMFNLEEKWRHCKSYQKFLYIVSPVSWRMSQNAFRKDDVFMKDGDDEEAHIFGRYRRSMVDQGISATDIASQFRNELSDNTPPQLYFTEPQQLMDIFRFMEIQNLNSLLYSEQLVKPLDQVKNNMKVAEHVFDQEIKKLQETIDRLECEIQWEEGRLTYLEEVALTLIETEFKKLLSADDVLNLHVFVEDVYETRVAPNDANLSMMEMMNGIEEKYRDELKFLEEVPSEQVSQLEGSWNAEQMTVMRLAERAAKQYAEMETLTNSLNKAFAPPYVKPKGKGLKKRSPPQAPPKKVAGPSRSLTQEEAEYLEYFTDFCKNTDDPKDYGVGIGPYEDDGLDKVESDKNAGGLKLLRLSYTADRAQGNAKKH